MPDIALLTACSSGGKKTSSTAQKRKSIAVGSAQIFSSDWLEFRSSNLLRLKNGIGDGALIAVSRNLKRAVSAKRVAPTLQAAVEKWRGAEQRMKELSTARNAGDAMNAFDFEALAVALSVLRAYR